LLHEWSVHVSFFIDLLTSRVSGVSGSIQRNVKGWDDVVHPVLLEEGEVNLVIEVIETQWFSPEWNPRSVWLLHDQWIEAIIISVSKFLESEIIKREAHTQGGEENSE